MRAAWAEFRRAWAWCWREVRADLADAWHEIATGKPAATRTETSR